MTTAPGPSPAPAAPVPTPEPATMPARGPAPTSASGHPAISASDHPAISTSDRPTADYRLYLVTDPAMTAAYGLVRTVLEAVEGGVTLVQLRDTQVDDATFVRIGRELHTALAGRVPLIINDRVHLVAAIGAEGAHVGQGDLPIDEARAALGPDRLLGLSVQTVGHLEVARALGEDLIDYVGIGPVWDTATKPDAAEAGGPERTAVVAAASPWPSVAIGGIGPDRVRAVRATGVDGISVVSAICGRPSPREAAATLRRAWGR
ncbi:MAG: thiamine phosphate synthase [Raineyella sp.]|nr:thiamine phosphate synthase [Raineyella sp.]MEA5153298.1 thiamine phosphate synthase [Raineyella sp.]